jgi:hypothetical protein
MGRVEQRRRWQDGRIVLRRSKNRRGDLSESIDFDWRLPGPLRLLRQLRLLRRSEEQLRLLCCIASRWRDQQTNDHGNDHTPSNRRAAPRHGAKTAAQRSTLKRAQRAGEHGVKIEAGGGGRFQECRNRKLMRFIGRTGIFPCAAPV